MGHGMRAVWPAAPILTAALFCFSASAADASAWDEIRSSVYGTKAIADGRGVIKLTAPYRPQGADRSQRRFP